jgi:hypothetical protein
MRTLDQGRSLYRIYDPDNKNGCHEVGSYKEATEWCEKKWGIFWTVNQFSGPRKKENCVKILSWAVDLDDGTKPEQLKRIKSIGIDPSAIVETKNGYHVYYDAINGDIENYRPLVERIVEKIGGDKNAKDVCRILRVPAYVHWKDQNDPFGVKLIYSSNAEYTENEMRKFFPLPEEEEKQFTAKTNMRSELKFQKDTGLWERIYNLDCKEALKRISGTSAMNHEMVAFRRTASGNENITINGKGTACWIDKNGRIGSSDSGGPTIWQWVRWYGHDNKKTYELLKQYMPEVFSERS